MVKEIWKLEKGGRPWEGSNSVRHLQIFISSELVVCYEAYYYRRKLGYLYFNFEHFKLRVPKYLHI